MSDLVFGDAIELDGLVYGIDLGTTYSCIASYDGQNVEVILNKENEFTTPSVVSYEDPTHVVVGSGAKERAVIVPDKTISFVKRLMGNSDCAAIIDGKDIRPEEVSALILKKLAEDAKAATGEEVKDVIITCPAYFGTNEIKATENAGKIAGLNVIDIVNEPTAAAFSYGVAHLNERKVFMVYDLGGGTFDVTIMMVENGQISMISSEGNHDLGGKNWDDELMKYILEEVGNDHPEFDGNLDAYGEQEIRSAAEKAKKQLTERESTTVPYNFGGSMRGIATITREGFKSRTEYLLEETFVKSDAAIEEARKKGYDTIDTILLVGGSTKMPQVEETVRQRYNIEDIVAFEQDFSVAKGAALMAANEIGGKQDQEDDKLRKPPVSVQYISRKSYALRAVVDGERKCCNIIMKNTDIPKGDVLKVSEDFRTMDANATSLALAVYESDITDEVYDVDEQYNIGEAELVLSGDLPKGAPIRITFVLGEDGILEMEGLDVTEGQSVNAKFNANVEGMTEEEVTDVGTVVSEIEIMR